LDNQCVLFLNSTLDNGGLYLATETISVSNDFPRGLYLWHIFFRVIFIYFCQDLSPLNFTRAVVCCQHGQIWQCVMY